MNLTSLTTISGVTIWSGWNGKYIWFVSDLDICNDGSGPSHGDPSYQTQTAYYNGGKYLNADEDQYIVVPPQVRRMIVPVVMGCQARLTNMKTALWYPAMTGDIGPPDKTGEAAYCLAKKVNENVTYNSGDRNQIYLYELWPDIPAKVNDKSYKLEPA